MDVKVDIGENTAGLIEGLARQLQMATEQVYPYYVQTVYVEGITALVMCAVLTIVTFVGLVLILRRDQEDKEVVPIVLIMFLGVVIVSGLLMPSIMGDVFIPEKSAISEMIKDASKLR